MKVKASLFIVVALVIATTLFPQTQWIEYNGNPIAPLIYPNIRVHPNPSTQQFEVAITTHPSNPDIVLVAAVTQDTTALLNGTMGYYYTTDGGAIWSGRDTLPTHTNLSHWMGDPTVGIDTSGNIYVGGIYNDDYIFVDRSTDGGTNWTHTAAFPVPSGYHRPNLAIDTKQGSPYLNNIYVASTWVLFSRSTNNGQTFSPSMSIAGNIGSWRKVGPRLAVGSNGELYATWSGYDASSGQPINLGFNKSTDGGILWDTARSIHSFNGLYPSFRNVVLYSAPSVAVDRSSGPRQGTIYIVYDEKNPAIPDVFLISSTDGGNSWSIPVKVNQDTSGKDQWMPYITVDPATGNLFIVYYDSRNFSGNDSVQVYVSASIDGGATFQDILVSDVPFLPAMIRAPWVPPDYMGQYIGISALQGIIWPCWMDNRTGFHQAYTARIEFPPTSVRYPSQQLPSAFTLEQNYPNPFNPGTKIKYSIPKSSKLTIKVFDVLGKEVAVLVDEEKSAGNYELEWNAGELPGGVYFYQLKAEDFIQTKKMVLMK